MISRYAYLFDKVADFHSLIQEADKALYQAEALGREMVVEYLMDDLKPQQSLSDKSKFHP